MKSTFFGQQAIFSILICYNFLCYYVNLTCNRIELQNEFNIFNAYVTYICIIILYTDQMIIKNVA